MARTRRGARGTGRLRIAAALLVAAGLAPAPTALAQDHNRMYAEAELQADAERLSTAFRKIYEIGVLPALTDAERAAIGDVRFSFPTPQPGDFMLDFYAYEAEGQRVVAAPILSLKALEDLTTAFAWLYSEGYSLGAIDLYYAMMTRRDPSAFPDGRYPPILPTLGAPADAHTRPPVDKLSLSLRNEAFAFILIHELGHLRHRHKGYDEITARQAQADEVESDRFALDVLGRTGTPALGAALFFQAQAYSLPNRGQFDSDKAWLDYAQARSTHPVTTDRIRALARYASGDLARARPREQATWVGVGLRLRRIVDILEDRALQDCLAKVAAEGDPRALKPTRTPAGHEQALFAKHCS